MDTIETTTDPLITYDWIMDVWIVQVDDKTEAQFYGGNYRRRAKELADLVRAGQFGTNRSCDTPPSGV